MAKHRQTIVTRTCDKSSQQKNDAAFVPGDRMSGFTNANLDVCLECFEKFPKWVRDNWYEVSHSAVNSPNMMEHGGIRMDFAHGTWVVMTSDEEPLVARVPDIAAAKELVSEGLETEEEEMPNNPKYFKAIVVNGAPIDMDVDVVDGKAIFSQRNQNGMER